jgi:NhaP-type Na+/H+ or K+/H+ antiporter
MLPSTLWILFMGFFGGQIARRLGAPPLLGMLVIGILIGPEVGNVLGAEVLNSAEGLRTLAVMIILMRAGLGLDRQKLARQGSVALRLGLLPALSEMLVVGAIAIVVFNFDPVTALLLGCILAAESPAVIVPGMLRLKSLGWGVDKGIPDAILTGSALSDVLLLLVFSLLLGILRQDSQGIRLGETTLSPLQVLPLELVLRIGLGLVAGYLAAHILVSLLVKQHWTQKSVQDVLIGAAIALFLIVFEGMLPLYSGYLAVMTLGFVVVQLDAPLGRRLREGFDGLWMVAEIVLFVLLGATLPIQVLGEIWRPGLLLLLLGIGLGRSLGWYLSTLGSDWTWKERLFLLPGNVAKATVQAAIGAVPLAAGVAGGEEILALAVLSILVTAPLGAWGTQHFAPLLLERGVVDPTQVGTMGRVLILAAVDTSPMAERVLLKAADLARRSDGEVLVLSVSDRPEAEWLVPLQEMIGRLLVDIRHRVWIRPGVVPETIVEVATLESVSDIVIGQPQRRGWDNLLKGSVSQTVLEMSPIPVILVKGEEVAAIKSG